MGPGIAKLQLSFYRSTIKIKIALNDTIGIEFSALLLIRISISLLGCEPCGLPKPHLSLSSMFNEHVAGFVN